MVFCFRAWLINISTRDVVLGDRLSLGRNLVFETHRSLAGHSRITVKNSCCLEDGVRIEAWGGDVVIGEHVFIGPYAAIYGHGGVTVGDATLISMHCRILSSKHTVPEMGVDMRSQPDIALSTKIGRDVWLGAGVTVVGGIVIGDGCVVGAGSVVTKNLPPGSIAYGVPAVVRGWRQGVSGGKS